MVGAGLGEAARLGGREQAVDLRGDDQRVRERARQQAAEAKAKKSP